MNSKTFSLIIFISSLVLVLIQLLALIALDNQRVDVSNAPNSGSNLFVEVLLGIGIGLTIILAGVSIYKLLSKKTIKITEDDSPSPYGVGENTDNELNDKNSQIQQSQIKQSPIKQSPIQQSPIQRQSPIQQQNQYPIASDKISNKLSNRSLSDLKQSKYLNTLNTSIASNYN